METQAHQYQVPRVVEVLPEWRQPKFKLRLLAEMQSLPDNVFILRPGEPTTKPPEAA